MSKKKLDGLNPDDLSGGKKSRREDGDGITMSKEQSDIYWDSKFINFFILYRCFQETSRQSKQD